MRILVTGGRGQLGRETAELLAEANILYDAPGHDHLDVTSEEAVKKALQGENDDQPVTAVVHTAAYTKVDLAETEIERAYAVNAAGARILAVACQERDIPLIYISTDFVFPGTAATPYEIHAKTSPLNVYGKSKLAGEQAVREVASRHYIVRTAWVFGPYGHNFPRAILQGAASRKPLRVVDDQVGSPTYTRDLAEAILALLGVRAPMKGITASSPGPAPYGIYHVTNQGHCSWFTFAQEILRQAGWTTEVEPIRSSDLARPAPRPAYSVLSLDSIQSRGIQVRPWEDALSTFLTRLKALSPELFPDAGATT